jgi:hypothetical protein
MIRWWKGWAMALPWPENRSRARDVGTEDILIDLRSFPFQPGEQGRTEIEADAGVVVGDSPYETPPV